MTIGTGIAILGVWMPVAAALLSPSVRGEGVLILIVLALTMTGVLA